MANAENNSGYNIAVLGDEKFTLGFRLAGVRKIIPAKNEAVQSKIEAALEDKETGVLVLDQKDIDSVPARLQDKIRGSSRPVVVPVSRDEKGSEILRALVRRAIGVDVWEKK